MLTKNMEISFKLGIYGFSYLKLIYIYMYRQSFKNSLKNIFGKLQKASPNFTALHNDISCLKNAPRFNIIHRRKTAQHVALLLKDHSCLPRGQNATTQWWTPRFTNQLHFWKGKVLTNLGARKDSTGEERNWFCVFLIYYIVFCMYLGVSQVCVSMSFKGELWGSKVDPQSEKPSWKEHLTFSCLAGRGHPGRLHAMYVYDCIWDLQTQRFNS